MGSERGKWQDCSVGSDGGNGSTVVWAVRWGNGSTVVWAVRGGMAGC